MVLINHDFLWGRSEVVIIYPDKSNGDIFHKSSPNNMVIWLSISTIQTWGFNQMADRRLQQRDIQKHQKVECGTLWVHSFYVIFSCFLLCLMHLFYFFK